MSKTKGVIAVDIPDTNYDTGGEIWVLRLYVTGHTAKSRIALVNLKKICEEYLKGSYQIEVIDLIENPELAKQDQIVAVPVLVRKLPPSLKKIIGDLSDKERVLAGLEIWKKNNLLPDS